MICDGGFMIRCMAVLLLSMLANGGPEVHLTLAPGVGNPRNSEGDFVKLADGKLLFIYTRFTGGGADNAAAELASRISNDGGMTWSKEDSRVPAMAGKQNTM